MRSRSSRLFVVLLHLVGCPQHFHHTFEGIVGVQPWPIVLETLSTVPGWPSSSQHETPPDLPEPVWLQDAVTQTCLGPQGTFTADCGDATLWLPVPQAIASTTPTTRRRRRRRRGDSHSDNDTTESRGVVFYLVDRDVADMLEGTLESFRNNNNNNKSVVWWNPPRAWKQRRQALPPLECLVWDSNNDEVSIQVCDPRPHRIPRTSALPQWAWSVEEDSSLRPVVRAREGTVSSSTTPRIEESPLDTPLCATLRPNESPRHSVHLAPCQETPLSTTASEATADPPFQQPQQQIELSLVRYWTNNNNKEHATRAGNPEGPSSNTNNKNKSNGHQDGWGNQESMEEQPDNENDAAIQESLSESSPLPFRKRDLAHMAALDRSMHPELPSRPRLLFEARSHNNKKEGERSHSSTKGTMNVQIKTKERLATLHNANPILLVGGASSSSSLHDSLTVSSSTAATGDSFASSSSSVHHRKRRIPVHPYIADCKNEVWTDPQTGLDYPTDLSSYLGYDRKEKGRHTIMGVGQYRKGYVIKVYGIAYYVSKRDVLADPFFEQYADLSADELRQHPEFFEHLRLHPQNFERSLYIKTNMQLSAEAIRGSLQADWSMLTEEAKDLILESSMRPQPVDGRTLEIIQDASNPSKCSCESIAPEEYHADTSCCARGTELVFTWLKNGDVVCRLNGRVVDVFPRPDIAEGIFFEYLRNDDPISKEFHDNVVDGFPFLLSPLTQVQGFHQHVSPSPKQAEEDDEAEGDSHTHGVAWLGGAVQLVGRGIMHVGESMVSHASSMAEGTQRTMTNAASHVQQGAKTMLDSARSMSDGMAKEMTRRRELVVRRATGFSDMVLTTVKRNPLHTLQQMLRGHRIEDDPSLLQAEDLLQSNLEAAAAQTKNRRLLLVSRWLGDVYYYAPDEIGPMIIHPTMNMTRKIFLFLVHLYLLLLVIVSFPGSYSTRTKFIYCRKTQKLRRLSSSSSMVLESDLSALCLDEDPDGDYEEDEDEDEEEDDGMALSERSNITLSERSRSLLTPFRRSNSNSTSPPPSRLPFSPRYVRRGLLKYPMRRRQSSPSRRGSSLSDGEIDYSVDHNEARSEQDEEETVGSALKENTCNRQESQERRLSARRAVSSLVFGVRQLSPSLLSKQSTRSNSDTG